LARTPDIVMVGEPTESEPGSSATAFASSSRPVTGIATLPTTSTDRLPEAKGATRGAGVVVSTPAAASLPAGWAFSLAGASAALPDPSVWGISIKGLLCDGIAKPAFPMGVAAGICASAVA
jgi:hypothetical protein